MSARTSQLVTLLTIAVMLCLPTVAAACPLCAENLPSDGQGGNAAQGFFWSILFMMSVPFLLAGGFGGTLWYVSRKNALRRGPSTHS